MIPSEIGGIRVTWIGWAAFEGCSSLTSVKIPESVTEIGDQAFWDCSGLTGVEIPGSVTRIGDFAFRECSGLTGVEIPGSVTEIGDSAFAFCSGLTGVEIPESVTEIRDDVFLGCVSLTSMKIPGSVTKIGNSAFWDCKGLTGVEIPGSVTEIGNSAFAFCNGLTSVEIPGSVTRIGEEVFFGCSGLISVEISESVIEIGNRAFICCSSLVDIHVAEGNGHYTSEGGVLYDKEKTKLLCWPGGEKGSICIPEGVTVIGENAFAWCRGLTDVEIPGSVIEIGDGAFVWCSDLMSVAISEGMTRIGDSAFYGCNRLMGVEIPESVTKIGVSAFSECRELTSVEIPGSVTEIGDHAFSFCTGLTSVAISENVTAIGISTFYGCSSLTSVEIPGSLTRIGDFAFSSCSSLADIYYCGSQEQWDKIEISDYENDVLQSSVIHYNYSRPGGDSGTQPPEPEQPGTPNVEDYAYKELKDGTLEITGYSGSSTVLVVPSEIGGKHVTRIGDSAFVGCRDLESVSILEGVTQIGQHAFYGCCSLTSVSVPGSVAAMGRDSFLFCSSLTDIHVAEENGHYTSEGGVLYNKEKTRLLRCPEGKKGAFLIPDGVTGIGDSAFRGCSGLSSVKILESVTEIGDHAFCGCNGLESVEIPGSVKEIGTYAFSSCGGLESVNIQEGVTVIGDHAFEWCSDLKGVEIPGSVTRIGDFAFSSCSSLADIYYGGSRKQWNKIEISDYENDVLQSAAIHYSSDTSDPEQKPQKKAQSIKVGNMVKTYGVKPFSLRATALGKAKLSYASSNRKVASVASNGKVTVKGCGVAKITVRAAETKDYRAASKTVTLTVKPRRVSLVSVKSKKKKTVFVKWKRDAKASGYLIECATDRNFKKQKTKITVSRSKTVSATVKKLKAGKRYYVRVCAYTKNGKKKIQGDWSKLKTVKVKK